MDEWWDDDGSRCLSFGDERRLWSLDNWRLIINVDDSNGNDDDIFIGNGERDWDRDEWRFLFFLAFVAIDIISTVGSDGNKRHKASAQRGSISLRYKYNNIKKQYFVYMKFYYLTITSYFNRFVLIPWIEQM